MKGVVSLVLGIIALPAGVLCFASTPMGFKTAVFLVVTMATGFTAAGLGNRAWTNNKQVTGLIGAILGLVGFGIALIGIIKAVM